MTTQDLISYYSSRFKTPSQVQKLLHSLRYNRNSTLSSATFCLKRKSAHCLEGVFVAAALLENHGYEPLVLSLESQDGLDHCLFVYNMRGRWGAVGKSRDLGLNGRKPVFRSLRDLVWSYFDPYIDHSGKVTAWQIAHLDEIGVDWRRSSKNVWALENHLLKIPHYKLPSSQKRYERLFKRFKNGLLPESQDHWL